MTTVSPASPREATAIAELLTEMDRFYGAVGEPEPLYLRIQQINEALFADPPAAYALLARDNGTLAGIATYSFLWPAVGLTRSLYLKELYVADRYRNQGVGRRLIDELIQVAGKTGCSRVEWTTDTDNPGAQRFYAELGFPPHPSKIFFRLTMG